MTDLEIVVRVKRYPGVAGAAPHEALRDARFSARHGEFICVLGPSGCGKTTLLNIIAGLGKDFEGQLTLPTLARRRDALIGYVFQNPRLLPWRTVIENIHLVLTPEQISSGEVEDLLASAGLDKFRDTYPSRLSLGLSRRVALVRAFGVEPDLLLMDEPFVSLDEPTAQRLRFLLLRIWQDRRQTVIFVTHNLREAILLGDRLVPFSSAPGTVLADLPLEVPHKERADPAAVEAIRAVLISDKPELFRDL